MNNTPPGLRLVCGLLIDDLTFVKRFLPCERFLSCFRGNTTGKSRETFSRPVTLAVIRGR